jgi:hypothetical protein
MKQQRVIFICTLLIITLALTIINPLDTVAQQHGNVIIGGQVFYQPRYWNGSNWGIGKEIQVDLYEKDLQGNNHRLTTTYTNSSGFFVFPSMINWWEPDNRQLNIFFVVVTNFQNTRVTDVFFRNYAFASSPTFLSHDGLWDLNFFLTSNWQGYRALWIFEDIRNAWNYVYTYAAQYDPGPVIAVWEPSLECYPIALPDWQWNCGTFTYAGTIPPHFVFIQDSRNIGSPDIVAHETGHMYTYNANGWWYTGCTQHWMFNPPSNANCAWSEGWADFFPLLVNGDHCCDVSTVNPCQGRVDIDFFNLEAHNRGDNPQLFPGGDTVEGRVAGALYDLYDSYNEGFDRTSAGFLPIAQIAFGNSQITTFQNYWNNWIYSYPDSFSSGLTVWWNTINYVNVRLINLPFVRK